MQLPEIVEVKGIRVLTSGQIAECYGTTLDCIKQNFHANRKRYVEGKHYIALSGDELKAFKDWVRKSHLVNNQVRITNLVGRQASHLYLWTEKGALLHAKSLNTDKAWEVYDYLVDFYFRVKEKGLEPVKKEKTSAAPHPMTKTVVNIPENHKAQEAIQNLKKALNAAEVMIDGSNRYLCEADFNSYSDGIRTAISEIAKRASLYLSIQPKLIEKQY